MLLQLGPLAHRDDGVVEDSHEAVVTTCVPGLDAPGMTLVVEHHLNLKVLRLGECLIENFGPAIARHAVLDSGNAALPEVLQGLLLVVSEPSETDDVGQAVQCGRVS